MTATEPQQWNGQGGAPIWDADHLMARIQALDPERQQRLGEAWAAQGHGEVKGRLLDAETYRTVEALVSGYEPGATGDDAWARMSRVADQLYALPEHIQTSCQEALSVYAGMPNPRAITITSWGRIAEAERVVAEAVAYAAEQADIVAERDAAIGAQPEDAEAEALRNYFPPSVADLPPADDTADQIASDTYPGTKAKAEVVLAWVDWPTAADREDYTLAQASHARLNRAARAYAQEQDRATQRKGLTAKLVEILGPEGLAKVNDTLEAHKPPPMDLGGGPTSAAEETVGAGASVDEAPVASADGSPPSSVEAEPAPAVTISDPAFGNVETSAQGMVRTPRHRERELYRRLSETFAELAEVL